MPTKSVAGPGGKTQVVVDLKELWTEQDKRLVTFAMGTRSTDTTLFFSMGTVQDTANTQWGRKLRKKLHKAQCGPPATDIFRIMVVNFTMADTGWPEFICERSFAVRFKDLVLLLSGKTQAYDAVLPAQIGKRCCFGEIVLLDREKEAFVGAFSREAGLDIPCQPRPEPTLEEMQALFADLEET
ncbi:MAG: hypothetical protein NTZ09_01615 [Candidatus Hydrogenedentes bacterium]|nr:hypothetical protein [Candidatus Hydrogenedentota bacterium]